MAFVLDSVFRHTTWRWSLGGGCFLVLFLYCLPAAAYNFIRSNLLTTTFTNAEVGAYYPVCVPADRDTQTATTSAAPIWVEGCFEPATGICLLAAELMARLLHAPPFLLFLPFVFLVAFYIGLIHGFYIDFFFFIH